MRSVVIFLALCAVLIGTPMASAQSLDSTLQNLAQDAAIGYVQPIVSGFGADLNSGWMYRAPQATVFGFDFDFGIVAMGAFMPDDAKKFSRSGSVALDKTTIDVMTNGLSTTGGFRDSVRNAMYGLSIGVSISGPTLVGSKTDSVKISYTGNPVTVRYTYGGNTVDSTFNFTPATQATPVVGFLEDLPLLPLLAPQLSIGTVYGTKIAIRYLPDIEIDKDLGKFSYFGFGIQHNPFMWIPVPDPPLDVSIGYFTQTLKVGTIFEANASMFGVQASKTFGPGAINITPYAGFGFESSSMKISYSFERDDPFNPGTKVKTPISFELDGENSSRLTFGLSLKLAILKINADYNIAKFNTFSAGLGIII
jgi:hypothetical protein